jgi:hypothetical protein
MIDDAPSTITDIRETLEDLALKSTAEVFESSSWALPLKALSGAIRILDRLKRRKFFEFLLKAFPTKQGKQSKEAVVFINTVATWIDLFAGRDVVSSNDTADTRFQVGEDEIYVDVKSVSSFYSYHN